MNVFCSWPSFKQEDNYLVNLKTSWAIILNLNWSPWKGLQMFTWVFGFGLLCFWGLLCKTYYVLLFCWVWQLHWVNGYLLQSIQQTVFVSKLQLEMILDLHLRAEWAQISRLLASSASGLSACSYMCKCQINSIVDMT